MVDAVTASRFPRRDTYDLADIADLVIELHSCVHNAASDIAGMRGDLGAHRLEVAERLGHVGERVAKLEGKSEAIGQRLGVVDSAPTQKPAFPKPWQIIGAICGGVGGFLAIYKVCVALLPALHKALMTVS